MATASALLISLAAVQWFADTGVDAEPGPVELFEMRQAAETAYIERDAKRLINLSKQLTEADPHDPSVWYGLSRAYEWEGALDAAIAAAERVQEIGYSSRDFLSYRLAQLHARAGHEADALTWLSRALQEGYEDRPEIQHDPAFSGLRGNTAFQALAGVLPPYVTDRNSGLRFDVDYLVEEARRMHAGPDRPAHSEQFARQARELREAIPGMSDAEVYVGLMRLLATLVDGHSAIYGPDPDTPLQLSSNVLPLKFYWFDEGLYIVDGIGPGAALAGLRVRQFGNVDAEVLLQRMSVLRGLDNSMMWKWMGPQFYIGSMQLLVEFGATLSPNEIELTLEDAKGQISVHTVAAGAYNIQRKLRPSPAASGATPVYLSNVEENYWMASLPEAQAIYVQFNQVRDAEEHSIGAFADELRQEIETQGAQALIIDVRHNNGGNNYLLQPLVNTLIAFEQANIDHQVFVIAGRNTFSAAQNFISRIERATDAIFVGEPSASSPNFVGEETNLLLPYSRVRGSISTRYWQESYPDDERPWIQPDMPVAPAAADYFAGRDAALEAILELLSRDD